ncbi:MAG: RNA polymerase sigma factor [Bacteroidales bacterium]
MSYKGDAYYISQVLEGRVDAFSRIVERHKDHAFNLAIKICGNREEAEEVAQDSFLKAYRSLGSFQSRSSFSTWLYRIIFNTAISKVRTKNSELLSLEDFPAESADFLSDDSTGEEAEVEYRNSLVSFALQKILPEDRALITLYYYDEKDIAEIAVITGMTQSNVKVRLFRARQKMAEIIKKAENKIHVCHE